MSEIISILNMDGFCWLVLAVFLAAVVRGFTGFGSALVYLPIAAQFLPPAVVIASMVIFGLVGPLPLLPRAIRNCAPAEVIRLSLAAFVGIPIGVYLLTQLDPTAFRWMVSFVALITLITLASGWRYERAVSHGVAMATGFMSGIMAGFLGLAGPPVILLYLGGRKKSCRNSCGDFVVSFCDRYRSCHCVSVARFDHI